MEFYRIMRFLTNRLKGRSGNATSVEEVSSKEKEMYKSLILVFGKHMDAGGSDMFCAQVAPGKGFDLVTWKKLVASIYPETVRSGDFHVDGKTLCWYPLWHPAWEYILNRPRA